MINFNGTDDDGTWIIFLGSLPIKLNMLSNTSASDDALLMPRR